MKQEREGKSLMNMDGADHSMGRWFAYAKKEYDKEKEAAANHTGE